MSDVATKGGGDASEDLDALKGDGGDSSRVDSLESLVPSSLKRQLLRHYGRRPVEIVSWYLRTTLDLSAYANKVAFLDRCRSKSVVPAEYRVECPDIKKNGNVVRLLDKCSYKLMLVDLDYNRLGKAQVSAQLQLLHKKLATVLHSEDLQKVLALCKDKYEKVFEATREKQRAMFAELIEEYELNGSEEEDEK